MKKSFIIGSVIVMLAVTLLSAVSGYTTFNGMQNLLDTLWVAILGTVGIQGLMLGLLWVLHGGNFYQRLLGSLGYLIPMAISVTFSFVGLDGILRRHINEVRDPQNLRAEFERARDLQEACTQEIRAAALEHTRGQVLAWRAELERAQGIARNPRRRSQTRRAAEQHALHLRGRVANLENLLRSIQTFQPHVGQVTVGAGGVEAAYSRLRGEREALAQVVWSQMPAAFRQNHPLPPVPSLHPLSDGSIREGRDHPFVETLSRLRNPEQVDQLALSIAVALDTAPPLVLWLLTQPLPWSEVLRNFRRSLEAIDAESEKMKAGLLWRIGGSLWRSLFARSNEASKDDAAAHARDLRDLWEDWNSAWPQWARNNGSQPVRVQVVHERS